MTLPELFGSFFGGGIAATLAIIWIIKNPEKAQKWAAWLVATFAWVSRRLEYSNVALTVQSRVNSYGKALSDEAPDVLPYPMKIQWVRDAQSAQTSLRNGELIVALDYAPNRDRNLVVSTLAYLRKGLLPVARPYVDPTLAHAIDFTIAKDIFASSGQHLATQYFFENHLDPEIAKQPRLAKDCETLDVLSLRGYFTRILLRQLQILGDRLYPATPDPTVSAETRAFADFLRRIATKEPGVDVPGGLAFTGSKIRVNVMLIAKLSTLQEAGLKPHKHRIQMFRNAGVEYLYISAIGTNNVLLAQHLSREQEAAGALLVLDSQQHRFTLSGRDRSAACILCRLLPLPKSRPYEDIGVIVDLVNHYVPEVADGKIEIIYVARSAKTKSKIVVNPVLPGIDALAVCANPTKLRAMQFALGGEMLDFVLWSDDPKSLIISALAPLPPEQVLECTVDTANSTAICRVRDSQARDSAMGANNVNHDLAEQLTGYWIVVDVGPQPPTATT